MIPLPNIIKWRDFAPWAFNEQVEQDLIMSRILIEIFSNNFLRKELAFRGGTALHKLFFHPPARYSDDIDLVRTSIGSIKKIIDTIRDCLDVWLGEPKTERSKSLFKLCYNFVSEISTTAKKRIKIEINTREHESLFGVKEKLFFVNNPWFDGKAKIRTYSLEELLGTKFRALYQRKKGRDLFDLGLALEEIPSLDVDKIIQCLEFYLENENKKVTQAQFKRNFKQKTQDPAFLADIEALLPAGNMFPMTLPIKLGISTRNVDMRLFAEKISEKLLSKLDK